MQAVDELGRLNSFVSLNFGAGLSLAMNDHFAPFMSVSGSLSLNDQDIEIAGTGVVESGFNIVSMRIGFDYRLTKSIFIEPSVSFGITEDAPDVTFSISLPYKFDPF